MFWRRSLLVLTLILSFSTIFGLPTDVKTKFPTLKQTSTKYRENAASNPHQIERQNDGTWTRTENAGARQSRPGEHADHMLEAQTVHAALKAQGKAFHRLTEKQREELSGLFNHKDNMQFVAGGTNIRKGGLTKAGLKGNAPKVPHADRDGYTQATVAPAAHHAKKIDEWLVKQGLQGNVVHTHLNAMEKAGMNIGTLRHDLASNHHGHGNQPGHTNAPATHHGPGAPQAPHHGTTHHASTPGAPAAPHHAAHQANSGSAPHAHGTQHPPQGHAQGHAQGHTQGHAQGHTQGHTQGHAQGSSTGGTTHSRIPVRVKSKP